MSRSKIAGSYHSIFNFLRTLHNVLHGGYTNLHFPQIAQGLFLSTYLPESVFSFLFGDSHSIRCEVFIVVLISISPMISEIEHFSCWLCACLL